MLTNSVIFIFAVVMLSAILVSQAGSKFGVPSLLLFLMVGMAFGTDGYGLEFNSSLTAQFIGMIALSVILFSGGLDTNFNDIRPVLAQGSLLATLGVVMMAFATSGIIYLASELFHLG
ncbi:MAG: cation:proton antiporter, partial [Rikenellaceae bacterium]|nr:cation:proton antiporter [Rikenellaceae bacterium]